MRALMVLVLLAGLAGCRQQQPEPETRSAGGEAHQADTIPQR